MNGRLAMLIALWAIGGLAPAAEAQPTSEPDPDEPVRTAWLGINPLAPLNDVHHGFAWNQYVPFLTDLEYGLAFQAGFEVQPRHAIDVRFSIGGPHGGGFSAHGQLQAGYRYLALPFADERGPGLYVGGGLRWWSMRYDAAGATYHTLATQLLTGLWLPLGPFYVDLRLALMIAGISWSSQPHTSLGADWMLSPAPGLFPVIPLLAVGVGVRF